MKIGLMGYGTVGGGVAEILSGGVAGLQLVKILRRRETEGDLFTTDPEDILGAKDVDAVVEAIGGFEPAYTYIKRALSSGKHVVTANKEVVALKLNELTQIAKDNGVRFMYEASCGGGIPFMKTLATLSAFNGISRVRGILNGTVNYILTRMQEGLSFEAAIKKAQELGFAEADPSADLSGEDSVRKLTIISAIAYHTNIDVSWVQRRPINGVTGEFTSFLRDKGYVLKYMACSEAGTDGVELSVEPCAVPLSDPFAGVENEFNAVELEALPNGRLFFSGKGAGRYPTASAMVADLVEIERGAAGMAFEPSLDLKPRKTRKNDRFFLLKEDGRIIEADALTDCVFRAKIID